MVTKDDALKFPCLTCEAPAGEMCRYAPGGNYMVRCHVARYRTAGARPQHPVEFRCRQGDATFYTGAGVLGHMKEKGHDEWKSVEREFKGAV